MDNSLIKVGKYNKKFNELLGLDLGELDIYRSKGLPAHMIKSNHEKCLKYIDFVPEIISNPDYIGSAQSDNGEVCIDVVKIYKDNVMVGIKLDSSKGYLYVATMFDIQAGKIERRLNSGRLKKNC